MTTLKMGNYLEEFLEKREIENQSKNQKSFEDIFGEKENEPEETDEYKQWISELEKSENPSEMILAKIKESLSEDDGKCLDLIYNYFSSNQENSLDIQGIQELVTQEFPDFKLNNWKFFHFAMILVGSGLIQLENY